MQSTYPGCDCIFGQSVQPWLHTFRDVAQACGRREDKTFSTIVLKVYFFILSAKKEKERLKKWEWYCSFCYWY